MADPRLRLPGLTGGRLGSGTRLPGLSGGMLPSQIRAAGYQLPIADPGFARGENDLIKVATRRNEYMAQYERELMEIGLSRSEAKAAAQVAFLRKMQELDRPSTFLNIAGKVLSAPAEAIGGFASGFLKAGPNSSNPWDYVTSLPKQAEAGYHEAGTWINTDKGWGEGIKESHPDDWLGRHSGSIGFAASLLFDPVMYISFGATIPSKIYAARALHDGAKKAMIRADEILAKDGMFWGTKYTDRVELFQAIRRASPDIPQDMPEALDMLRGVGMSYKKSMRELKPWDAGRNAERFGFKTGQVEPSISRVIGAYLLPTGVKGGRGIRFAGMEIPGTGELTTGLARRMRAPISQRLGENSPVIKGLAHGFANRAEMRLIGDDTIRAMALTEMALMKAELMGAKTAAQAEAREIAKGGGKKYVAPAERMGAHREASILTGVEPTISHKEGYAGISKVLSGYADAMSKKELSEATKVTREMYDEMIGPAAEALKQKIHSTGTQASVRIKAIMDKEDYVFGLHTGEHSPVFRVDVGKVEEGLEQPGFTAYARSDGSWEVMDVLPAGDRDFFRSAAVEEDYFKVVDAVRGANPDDIIPLHRGMSQEEMAAWAAGESVPAGKFFSDRPTTELGQDISGQFPDLFSFKARRGDVFESEPGVFQLAKESKLEGDLLRPIVVPGRPTIVAQVHKRVTEEIALAKSVRISERDSREMWKAIEEVTDDPVEAIGMFVFKNQVLVRSRQFIQRLLDNPLFATKIERGATLPDGYKPFFDPVSRQHYAVLGEMESALNELVNPQFIDQSLAGAMGVLQLPQNYWKQFATSANPSFHVMNFLGAIWNNLYAGVYNPADYVKALTTLYNSRMEEAVQSGAEKYLGRKAVSTPKTRAAAELVGEARVRGATSENASIYSEIEEGFRRGTMEPFVNAGPPSVRMRTRDLVKRRANESKKRYALRQSRRATAAGFLATGNPIGVALLAPEAAAVGRVVGSAIEDVVRLAPFMKAAHDPVLLRYLDAFGPTRVAGMKHPGWSKEMQAATYDIGAAISKHFQFDYSDLTPFERKWAKSWFPFYTYYKKNFMLQMQLLAQAPRGVHTAQAVMNYANENGDLSEAMLQLTPEYFDQISAFQIPVPQGVRKMIGLPLDQPLFLNPKLPFLSLNLFPPVWQAFTNSGTPTSRKVGGILAPLWGSIGPISPFPLPGGKMLLEAQVGESLGLNRTLDYQRSQSNEWRNSWVPAPVWVKHMPGPLRDFMGIFPWGETAKNTDGNWMMTATGKYMLDQMATPFVTNLGQIIPTGGQDEGKAKADMVSWLTGVRLIPLDILRVHRAWGYRLESMLEGHRADLKDQGKTLDPQDQQTLSLVRAMIAVLEASWDRRQQELYGEEK